MKIILTDVLLVFHVLIMTVNFYFAEGAKGKIPCSTAG